MNHIDLFCKAFKVRIDLDFIGNGKCEITMTNAEHIYIGEHRIVECEIVNNEDGLKGVLIDMYTKLR